MANARGITDLQIFGLNDLRDSRRARRRDRPRDSLLHKNKTRALPRLELLEDRMLLSTRTVTGTGSANVAGALLNAIDQLNSGGGSSNSINFNVQGPDVVLSVPTSLSEVTGSGAYGGSPTLTATLTIGGSPLSGESVAFTLDVAGTLINEGSGTTDSSGVATLSGISLAGLGAGTVNDAVEASFAGAANGSIEYGSSSTEGDLTVTRAPLTITPTQQSKPYGLTLSFSSGSTQFTSSGLQNGETIGSVTLAVSGSGGTATAPVGSYTITASAATGGTFTPSNYNIAYDTGTLTVNPAPLNVTANSASVVAGQSLPSFSVSYSGFVLGQGPGVLDGSLAITTPATTASPAGSYPIVPSGLSSSNYAINYVDGALTVVPAQVSAPLVTVVDVAWQTIKVNRKKSMKVLDVFFSGALEESADDVAAYILDAATKSKKLGTRYTKLVPFKTASYNSVTNMVTLTPRGTIPTQNMQFTINASEIYDAEGRQVDGNGDGEPGGNYVALLNSHRVISAALPSVRAKAVSAKAIDTLLSDGHFEVNSSLRMGHSHSRQ